MDYMELSVAETKQHALMLAQQMEQSIQPDVIVFIAKGAYMIGCEVAHYFSVPVVEIFARRKGNRLKQLVSPLLLLLPTKVKIMLRKRELNSALHTKHSERQIALESGAHLLERAECIVIVDDSVDTGATLNEVLAYVKKCAPNATIEVAALNVFDASKSIVNVHYKIYENTILIGPWSKDSKYYTRFEQNYEELKRIGVF